MAVLHLVASSNGALFMKDYWDLSPQDVGRAMQWAIRVLADAASDPKTEGGAVTEGNDDHLGGTGRAASGSWRPSTCRARVPRLFQERAPDALRGGFEAASKRYGLPIDYLDARFVNDHCYMRMRPVGAPEPKPGKASSPPPRFVMWALARLHPELRRRARTARARARRAALARRPAPLGVGSARRDARRPAGRCRPRT